MKVEAQKVAVTYLRQALRQGRLSPSLLFSGPEGIGKRTVALETAKVLLGGPSHLARSPSSNDLTSCPGCRTCEKVSGGAHPDLLIVDGAYQSALTRSKADVQRSLKIETVRTVGKFLSLKPLEGHSRVAVLDDADILTLEAANALLKILEEPPAGTQLILIALDPRNLPSTIRSRCAHLPFRPLPIQTVADILKRIPSADPNRIDEAADASGGSVSHALQWLESEPVDERALSYSLDEFFDLLAHPGFRTNSRTKAEKTLLHFIEEARKDLEKGNFEARKKLEALLFARRQLDRYVSPRLVLENLYLKALR